MTRPTFSPVRRKGLLATAIAVVLSLLAVGAPAGAVEVGIGPGIVSGTVTTESGEPVAGIWINVSTSIGQTTIFHESTITDLEGHYEFSGLEFDTYGVQGTAFGYQNLPFLQAVLTEESPSATVDFVLLPFAVGAGSLSGLVTADGVALADHSVSLSNPSSGQNVYGHTDASGFYQFTGLANGTWYASSWAGPQYQYLYVPAATLSDAAPSAVRDIAFESWPSGTSRISGVVTDSATGEPIAGASVSVFSGDAPYSSNQTSDEFGAFDFSLLPEGSFQLHVWSFGYLQASQEIQLDAGESVVADHPLVATNATISGHITGPDGLSASGVYVHAYSEDGNSSGAESDENGDYVIRDLGGIEYTVSIGGPGSPYDPQERVVAAEANANVVADFTVAARTTGALMGVTMHANGDYYSEPVCVTLYSQKSKKPLADLVTTGDGFGDGTYSFDGLKPGSYTVGYSDCDDDPATEFEKLFLGGAKKFKDATFVTIVAGQDSQENTLTMTPRN